MHRINLLLGAVSLATVGWLSPAQAQSSAPAAQGRQAAIGELDCRTLLRLSGDERDFTIIYFHGFVSGRSNLQVLPVQELAAATDQVIDRCIDKPGEKLLAVFEQVRGKK